MFQTKIFKSEYRHKKPQKQKCLSDWTLMVNGKHNETFQYHSWLLTSSKLWVSNSSQWDVSSDISMPLWLAAVTWMFCAVSSVFPCFRSHLRVSASTIFYLLHTNKAMGSHGHLNLSACVTLSASLSLHVIPAANLLVLPVTFQQIPLVSLQPEVICSVHNHTPHSKHFQNGTNCRLRIISWMM